MNKRERVERAADKWQNVEANWRAWDMELRGRALRARLAAKLDGVKTMVLFFREMYGR